jgi:Hydrazine synthase alpha subunit middle domain/WD40-like Beta Propeller Repeat
MTGSEVRRLIVTALLGSVMSIALSGCGGGGSGSSSLLGGDQGPDPVVVDVPVMYVKRPLLVDDNGDLLTPDVRDPAAFMPGAELYFRDRASPSAAEVNVTAGVFPDDANGDPPLYDVKDLSPSYDGKQLVFAMHAPEIPNADPEDQPTWNIWIYDVNSASLRRVIASDITAEIGQDIAPHFLPDGRIVFASTRQRQSRAILLDEGKPQFAALEEDRNVPALTLHVMNDDGSDIHQISFNQSHDTDPSVLADGRIVYARWDNIADRDRFSLYTMNPDGTEQHLLYGIHSHATGPNGETIEFLEPEELSDGRVLVSLRDSTPQAHFGAAPMAIDTANYVDHDQPTYANQGLTADAQELLVPGSITLDDTPSPRGRFASVAPLFDGTDRLLVTWSQCRLLDPSSTPQNLIIVPCTAQTLAIPDVQEAPPLYGVWMFDVAQDTQQPLVTPQEGFAYSEAAVLEPRTLPLVRFDKNVAASDFDPNLIGEGVGEIHIRSVYDFDGTAVADIQAMRDPAITTSANQRPARFVRIVKPASIPDQDLVELDAAAFGVSQAQLMREVIGYAPVEPDGSVKVKVPANVAFSIDVLDVNGRRISERHQNWLTVKPGEVLECNGCHTAQSLLPHGRPDAEAPSANPGAPFDGLPFPNTEPTLFADAGESMAQTYTRLNGVPNPTVDIHFEDVWTDPNVRAKDASFDYDYSTLSTPAPVDPGCVANWTASCRIVINYETHIHPIWGVPRTAGANNVTCTSCHAPTDATGAAQLPAAQLDLSDGISPDEPAQFNSYRELLADTTQQVLQGNVLVPVLVQDTDANGNPLFTTDANGNQVPVLVPATAAGPMSPAGALASARFFGEFDGGTHAGWLTSAELKLVSEWLDGGAQYFNDPFAVPQN